uniref:Uncharacterized protein n=1 Tax=Cacopsylla melanoneura TaxID=428564 RepID=A0A8D9B9U9_9HEMI
MYDLLMIHVLFCSQADDIDFFKFRTVNRTTVSVRLAKSLEDLVDSPNPQNVLKFRLVCEYDDSGDTVRTSLGELCEWRSLKGSKVRISSGEVCRCYFRVSKVIKRHTLR